MNTYLIFIEKAYFCIYFNEIFVKMKALEADARTMNDFEIKGILVSFIGKAKRKQLLRVFETLKADNQTEAAVDTTSYALSPEQELELVEAIEETYHTENLISHKDALEKLARWLPK